MYIKKERKVVVCRHCSAVEGEFPARAWKGVEAVSDQKDDFYWPADEDVDNANDCTVVELSEDFHLQNRSGDNDASDRDGNGDDDEPPSGSSDRHIKNGARSPCHLRHVDGVAGRGAVGGGGAR